MIEIEIYPAYHGSGGYLHAVGHAGPGNDLICNAVSAIEDCFAANLANTWNLRVKRTVTKGSYLLRWNKSDRKGTGIRRANDAAGFAYNGLKALAAQYPDAVKVKWKRPEEHKEERREQL